ncbi:MAG: hypothetical protein AB7V59_06970 [Gammaproteobacteria bacterium]
MCQVSPDNVPLLSAFGTVFFAGGILSVLTGRTYFRGVVARAEDPFGFWSAVIGLLLIGGLCLVGVGVCPRG